MTSLIYGLINLTERIAEMFSRTRYRMISSVKGGRSWKNQTFQWQHPFLFSAENIEVTITTNYFHFLMIHFLLDSMNTLHVLCGSFVFVRSKTLNLLNVTQYSC